MQDRGFFEEWTPRALSVLRIVVALLFIEHGTQKLIGFPSGLPGPFPINTMPGAAGLIELIGGSLLLIGLLTRPVAFIVCGEMAVAYFMVHAPKSPFPVINQGEPAILFCFMFMYFFFAGAGSWSLDALLRKQPSVPRVPATGWTDNRTVRGS